MKNILIHNLENFEIKDYNSFDLVLGFDEAGRGAIAGPVSISLVSFTLEFLRDVLFNQNKIDKELL